MLDMTNKLLLADGLNIVRRCYEANPAPESIEKAKAAADSSFLSFKRAMSQHRPSHALAVFDYGGETWRHQLYAGYLSNRKPMPEVLANVLPALRDRLKAELGLPSVAIPGVEADDTIASVSLRWVAALPEAEVVVLTTDKDMCYLVSKGVQVYDHFNNVWRTPEWVFQKFGVTPAQIPDWLALVGDSVDCIPGVTGVGPKTAAKLLSEHGDLEGVLQNADSVRGKVGEHLRAERELARQWLQLTTLRTDVQAGLSLKDLRC